MTSHFLTAQPISGDTVRGTRVPLESIAEILAKKLTYRLSVNHFGSRDLYDIAVARRLDSEALDAALAAVPREMLEDTRTSLERLGPNRAGGRDISILHPVYAQDADDSAAIVRRLIGRHLDGRD